MEEGQDTNPSPEQLKNEMVKIMRSVRERGKELPSQALENRKPNIVAKIIWMLAQGSDYKSIRNIVGVSHEAIRRIDYEHSKNNLAFAEQRKIFADRYAMAAMEYTDLLFEKAQQLHDNPEMLAQTSPEKLATVVGIMQDKCSSLSGATSAELNHKEGLSIEDARALIEAAASRISQKRKGMGQPIEAELV